MDKLDKIKYVKQAEDVISSLSRDRKRTDVISLTSNKIRNILSMINELYELSRMKTEEKMDESLQSHIQYVKMRIIYEAGREKTVKEFLNKSNLLNYIDDIGNSREKLILVCRYMEALVAYHKYQTAEK